MPIEYLLNYEAFTICTQTMEVGWSFLKPNINHTVYEIPQVSINSCTFVHFFNRCQFWSPGIPIACVWLSVRLCMCWCLWLCVNPVLVHVMTHHPNLDQGMHKTACLESPFFLFHFNFFLILYFMPFYLIIIFWLPSPNLPHFEFVCAIANHNFHN